MTEPDHPHDVGGDDTRALTYDDIAKARGISRESAIRLAQRRGWRQERTNDGQALVYVPVEALTHQDDVGSDVRGGVTHVTTAIEAAASGGREALARADAETAREQVTADTLTHQVRMAEADVQELLARAERAQAEAQAARREAATVTGERDRLRTLLERAAADVQAAHARADALRQELDQEKAASLPRRVWRAIRGGGGPAASA